MELDRTQKGQSELLAPCAGFVPLCSPDLLQPGASPRESQGSGRHYPPPQVLLGFASHQLVITTISPRKPLINNAKPTFRGY